MSTADKIVIGTRGSALARWQADHITAELRRVHPGLIVEQQIVPIEPGLPTHGGILRPALHAILSEKTRASGTRVRRSLALVSRSIRG